jgi:hypothetical protein
VLLVTQQPEQKRAWGQASLLGSIVHPTQVICPVVDTNVINDAEVPILAHTYNPSYSGGRDLEDHVKPVQARS